jgi:hypothetical protein
MRGKRQRRYQPQGLSGPYEKLTSLPQWEKSLNARVAGGSENRFVFLDIDKRYAALNESRRSALDFRVFSAFGSDAATKPI